MKSSKEHLLADKDLSQWWASISHDPRFDRLVLIAGADIIQMLHPDKIDGATRILESLSTMADNPEQPTPAPTSGLKHDWKPETKK